MGGEDAITRRIWLCGQTACRHARPAPGSPAAAGTRSTELGGVPGHAVERYTRCTRLFISDAGQLSMTGRGGLQLRTQEEGVVSPDHYSMRERKKALGGGRGEVTVVVESSNRRLDPKR